MCPHGKEEESWCLPAPCALMGNDSVTSVCARTVLLLACAYGHGAAAAEVMEVTKLACALHVQNRMLSRW